MLEMINGQRGVLVLGQGVDALVGKVDGYIEDECLIFKSDGTGSTPPKTYVIPLTSVVYFRAEA